MHRDRTALIQIRNVPDDLHRGLRARAAIEGVTLSELALRELDRSMRRPTLAEMQQRIAAEPRRADVGETVAASSSCRSCVVECTLALAEVLDADLVTADARLAAAPGHDARVVLVA